MRILIITINFHPEPTIGLTIATELMKRGHSVEVLTTFPNYPGGRIYSGYKMKFFQQEVINGVRIIRVPLYPSHDRSSLRRILSYTSFAMFAGAIGPFCMSSADVAYVVQGPITIGWPACLMKMFRRIPYVFHIKDLWPDSLKAAGMLNNSLGLKLVDMYCRYCYRQAAVIAVPTPGIKKKLIKRGVPREKIHVVYNPSDDSSIVTNQLNDRKLRELKFDGKFNILFAGNMGPAQGLDTVLDAAKLMLNKNNKVFFTLIGPGVDVEKLKKKASQMQLTNVQILPPVPRTEIGSIINAADVLLVHLKKDPLFFITIPSKVQAYMSMGKPLLAAVPGDTSDLINNSGAGLICESENPRQLYEKVIEFCNMPMIQRLQMGNDAKNYYAQHLSLDAGINAFERVFKEVTGKK